jgi:hypothetical protein
MPSYSSQLRSKDFAVKRCSHCGGRFGLIVHRWLNERFCRAACRQAFLVNLDEKRRHMKRWLNFVSEPAA